MTRSFRFRPIAWGLLSLAAFLPASATFGDPHRGLSFDERVSAQEAIERVYYRHQLGATLPFEEAVPRGVLERKVRTYLKQSAALAQLWGTPVTAEMLRAEWERIARSSRFPDRLREIHEALGNDPVLIQECFARPALVNRLSRSFYAGDERWHPVAPVGVDADPEEARPRAAGRSWDDWWPQASERFDESGVAPVARAAAPRVLEGGRFDPDPIPFPGMAAPGPDTEAAMSCLPDDTWDHGSLDDIPAGRAEHTAVWTGSVMIIWGGSSVGLDTGSRYDPLTDTWAPTSTISAPSPRTHHTAVWTGTRMVVWGGGIVDEPYVFNDGGRYDPVSDTWTPTSTTGAPAAREQHVAAWTGTAMLVWGGDPIGVHSGVSSGATNTGGRYDPATDSWSPMTVTNAPTPRKQARGVWTGSRLLVWGGREASLALVNTGGSYNPTSDSWSAISTTGAPGPRKEFTAVWTGSQMVVWGGGIGDFSLNTGGRYDPAADLWTPTNSMGAPSERQSHTAIWTGSRMIVWGGYGPSASTNTGARYDPVADHWEPTAASNTPEARGYHTAVWTGTLMVVWGGADSLETGGRYNPASDSWTPTSTGGAPTARSFATAVWTGRHMIVWGGTSSNIRLDTGGRYDPLLDQWSATTLTGAPAGRAFHAAVWTGSRLVIWGGSAPSSTNTGSRYDPVADSWAATTLTGAPPAASSPVAVSTGRRMLVWSGALGAHAQYDPALDAWFPISTVNAPPNSPYDMRGVWTGAEMLVWNGTGGGRYNPVSNTWVSMSSSGQPSSRSGYSLVWTGAEMIVFGGSIAGSPFTILGTGARYHPGTNTWTPTLPVAAGRASHTAVWTGRDMVVWGGSEQGPESILITNSGARYDPATDTWIATAATGAPEPRRFHVGVWTGGLMIVWGGQGYTAGGGGRYALNQSADLDQDGTTFCGGDCDDVRAAVHPGAPEICDGLDDDCDGSLAPFEADGDSDGYGACEDCDDTQTTVYPGNSEVCDSLDNDCNGAIDGYPTSCGVGPCARAGACTAGVDSCLPGTPTPEACDGLDNDCNGSIPANELDQDGDGFRVCDGDCNDSKATTYPGAMEVNDGLDNNCSGDIDEISGLAGFPDPADTTSFCWPAQDGASEYEALRSNLASFTSGCGWTVTTSTCWSDPEVPPPGKVLYYLVRPTEPRAGSFGKRSSGVERYGLCGVERVCHDGVSDDGDQWVDCADVADCFNVDGCTATFTFIDTASNNLVPTALQSFLQSLPVTPADYIRFSLTGPSLTDFEWCAARADFYRAQYVALAPTTGTAVSGPWDRWHRTEGGAWVGPDTGAYDNLFGDDCVGPYSWCSEFDLGGHVPAIAPADTGLCEAFDYITCGDGTWTLTIELGSNRLNVCGF